MMNGLKKQKKLLVNRKVIKGMSLVIILAIIIALFLNKTRYENKPSSTIKIGVTQGLPSIIFNEVIKVYDSDAVVLHELDEVDLNIEKSNVEMYNFDDCWNNSTQLALSSDAIDLAVICSSKAQEFVQNDERFEIVPDAIINSSVIITKKDNPQTIGVSQNRKFEVDMVKDTFGEECEIKEISTRVLPYALEKGEVDGIVLDYIKSLEIDGKRVFMKEDKNYNTFSLVIKKSIKENKEYKKFIRSFNKVREEIMETDAFIKIISRERNKNYLDDRRRYEWQMLRLQITPLEE